MRQLHIALHTQLTWFGFIQDSSKFIERPSTSLKLLLEAAGHVRLRRGDVAGMRTAGAVVGVIQGIGTGFTEKNHEFMKNLT